MEWWTEIRPPNGPGVQFGGPTGIFSLVVLMSWWCALLKEKPEEERADCYRILKDIDQVFSMAINNMKNRPAISTAVLTAVPPLPSQSRKRGALEDTSSRKRASHGSLV